MSLAAELDKIREASGARIPADKREIMGAATKAQRDANLIDSIAKPGDKLPDFSLKNAYGVEVHSADLLSQGPMVLTVFRGVW